MKPASFAFVAAASLALFAAACTAETVPDGSLRRGSTGSSGSSSGADAPSEGATTTGGEGTSGDPSPGPAGSSGGSSSGSSGSSAPPAGVGNLSPGTSTVSWTVAGQSRSILFVVPTAITTKAVPLVIALHGNGDTASNFVATRGLQQLAETEGFVVAAPQGITQNVTVGGQQVNGVDWDAYRDLAGGNIDLALLDEIQKQLVKPGGQIDPKRVVVFGYSQGGYLGFRYGIDASTKLACAAVVAAASPLGSGYVANAARKIPFALTIGTNDFGINQARASKTALESAGHPLQYKEVAGAGHVPFPGTTAEPLDYCLSQSL